MMPDIIVNTRCLSAGITGVQRYTFELSKRLPDLKHISPARRRSSMGGHFWEQFILPRKLNHNLLWSPANCGPIKYENQVVTIHDAATLDHPEWFSKSFATWYRYLLPKLAVNARRIITVSSFSKSRLLAHLDIDPGKVEVIHNGVSVADENEEIDNRMCENRYFLYVGSIEPRKNLKTLLEAWRGIGRRGITLKIVGAQGKSFSDAGLASIPSHCEFLGRVDEKELSRLYRDCTAFIYPSVYEGFGFPPLEAMARKAIVLASDIPVHREVCGDVPIYFDPSDVNAIRSAILQVIDLSIQHRYERTKAGLLQASNFSWNSAARKTGYVLRETLISI